MPSVNLPNSSVRMATASRCCGNVMGMKTVLMAVMKTTVVSKEFDDFTCQCILLKSNIILVSTNVSRF